VICGDRFGVASGHTIARVLPVNVILDFKVSFDNAQANARDFDFQQQQDTTSTKTPMQCAPMP